MKNQALRGVRFFYIVDQLQNRPKNKEKKRSKVRRKMEPSEGDQRPTSDRAFCEKSESRSLDVAKGSGEAEADRGAMATDDDNVLQCFYPLDWVGFGVGRLYGCGYG